MLYYIILCYNLRVLYFYILSYTLSYNIVFPTLQYGIIQGVPLATEPGISLIILTPMKILQWNLNRSTFVVWEMKKNVSVVCVCNILISGEIIKEMWGSVASGTLCIKYCYPIMSLFQLCKV
jgi:hypothetical protein